MYEHFPFPDCRVEQVARVDPERVEIALQATPPQAFCPTCLTPSETGANRRQERNRCFRPRLPLPLKAVEKSGMRIKVQITLESGASESETFEVARLNRGSLRPDTLGLSLAEARAILAGLEQALVERQAAEFVAQSQRCPRCGRPRACKGQHAIVFRTPFESGRNRGVVLGGGARGGETAGTGVEILAPNTRLSTATRIWTSGWAPRGLQRMGCFLAMRRRIDPLDPGFDHGRRDALRFSATKTPDSQGEGREVYLLA